MKRRTRKHDTPEGPELQRLSVQELVRSGVPVEHLKIGECIFTRRRVLINTVLGSCVSLTFYDPESGASGMFHAMLPDSSMARTIRQECNYVNLATKLLLDRFRRLGIGAEKLEVKLFGGGNTLRPEERDKMRDDLDIGCKNVEAARSAMAKRSMRILCEDVLGDRGRKVILYTGTGQVWVRDVSSSWSG
ncbi:MAG: chemotaxis protein CheD, partial [Desulfovibrionaceae bacterium]